MQKAPCVCMRLFGFVAEREGFEPSVRASVHLISSQAHSASLAPLRGREFYYQSARKAKEEVFAIDLTGMQPLSRGSVIGQSVMSGDSVSSDCQPSPATASQPQP